MAGERTTAEILATLTAQARLLWGEADAERQRPALAQTAEEICRSCYGLPCRLTWSPIFCLSAV